MWLVFDVNGVIVPNIELNIINSYCKKYKKNRILTFIKYALKVIPYQKAKFSDDYFWNYVLGKNGKNFVKKKYFENDYLDKKLFDDLKILKKKYKIAILSNSTNLMSKEYRKRGFYDLADRVFLSDELKMMKPELRLFNYVQSELKAEKKDLFLIDDSWYNVLTAKLIGWNIFWFRDSKVLNKMLKKLS